MNAADLPASVGITEHSGRIVLVRHGRPDIDTGGRLSPRGFGLWVRQYDAAGIDTDSKPSARAQEEAGRCAYVVCSTLPRSLESARILGRASIDLCDGMFREMEMPAADLPFPRLSPLAWSVFFRLAWAAGYSGQVESFKTARQRARDCAQQLVRLAASHGSVMLVGHGTLNWFIARQLKAMGWSGPEKSPRGHWDFAVYQRAVPSDGMPPSEAPA